MVGVTDVHAAASERQRPESQPVPEGGSRLIAFAMASLLMLACAPQTTYRRAALVPAPGADVTVAPLDRGTGEASLSGYFQEVPTVAFPQKGDPALWVPERSMVAQASMALTDSVAVGLRFTRASLHNAEPSAVGTPDLRADAVWGLGPTLRLYGRLTTSVHVVALVDGVLTSVPWSAWERTSTGIASNDDYSYLDGGRESFWMWQLGGAVAWRYEWLGLYGGILAANQLLNVGFHDDIRKGSTLSAGHWGLLPFVSGRVDMPGMPLFGQVGVDVPFGLYGREGPGIQVGIGVRFESAEAKPSSKPAPKAATGISAPPPATTVETDEGPEAR